MGVAKGQSSLVPATLFLDENHSANPHLHAALAQAGVRFERHQDHFARGTQDADWIPSVAARGWILLTADARIRSNFLERQAVKNNKLRMFYFSNNNIGGAEMGVALAKALPGFSNLRQLRNLPSLPLLRAKERSIYVIRSSDETCQGGREP